MKTTYTETVCGTRQTLDNRLPIRAYDLAVTGTRSDETAGEFLEPTTALSDGDLEFPDHIELAFYSIYNLFQKYSQNVDIDAWIIVNQALAALERNSECAQILLDEIRQVVDSESG